MIRGIAFDFDGVLVESVDVKTKAYARLFEEYGEGVVSRVVDYHLTNGGVSRFVKFRVRPIHTVEFLKLHFYIRFLLPRAAKVPVGWLSLTFS